MPILAHMRSSDALPRCPGVYAIVHVATARFYIGSTVNLRDRWGSHGNALRRNQHCNQHLQRAWNCYGRTAFEFRVLDYVDDVAELVVAEQAWIDSLNPEFNICRVAGSTRGLGRGRPGHKQTEETRQRIAHAKRGVPRDMSHLQTPEVCAKRARSLRGRPKSPEHVAKMAECQRGKKPSAEAIARQSAARKGRPRSAQTRARMSAVAQGENNPFFGKHHSEETKARISATLKGRPKSPEHLAAIVAAKERKKNVPVT